MNREKHESSLLKVVSDAGSTPAASTKPNAIKAGLTSRVGLSLRELGRIVKLLTEIDHTAAALGPGSLRGGPGGVTLHRILLRSQCFISHAARPERIS